jgi:hypothetical protein
MSIYDSTRALDVASIGQGGPYVLVAAGSVAVLGLDVASMETGLSFYGVEPGEEPPPPTQGGITRIHPPLPVERVYPPLVRAYPV